MEYSYTDNNLNEVVTETRNVVILPALGDVNLDNQISVGDMVPIKNYTANVFSAVDSTVKKETYNLVVYRVMDTNFDATISVGDMVPIKNSTANIKLDSYYYPFTK